MYQDRRCASADSRSHCEDRQQSNYEDRQQRNYEERCINTCLRGRIAMESRMSLRSARSKDVDTGN